MFREYAVEPKTIGSDWQTFRYLIEKFGFEKGRLISQFPSKWFKEVYAVTKGLPDIERKRIEVKLKQIKEVKITKVVGSRRPYNPDLSWLKNALDQHAVIPFHAIIAETKPTGQDVVLVASEVDESHPLMVSPQDCLVPRVGTELAKAMSLMLISAQDRVLFIDPYFDIIEAKYQETLKACLDIVKYRRTQKTCYEIHFRHHHDKSLDKLEQYAYELRGVIPDEISITLYAWSEKRQGEDFHARYLLTDVGGIKVDAGFSAEGGHQNNQLSLLSLDLVQTLLTTFKRDSAVYDLVEPVLEIASDGIVKKV